MTLHPFIQIDQALAGRAIKQAEFRPLEQKAPE